VVRRDGGTTPAEVDGAPIQFEGKPAYQFFIRELTERARLEQQLRQAEKLSALGQMISGVAHELNNPLAVIRGYVELILNRHELPAQTRADLEKVARESERTAKLVSNFLSFAREQPAHRERVELNELVKRLVELRDFDFRVGGIEVRLDLDDTLPAVSADTDQIQQVLVNLVNNAVQAMAEMAPPQRLTIRTKALQEMVQLVVSDSGPGVPGHIVPHIFEPFFTTKEVGTGTGLGLSIVHSIMADHQGRIFYEPAEGGGASFVLELPIGEFSEKSKPATTEAAPAPGTDKSKGQKPALVLVLDDETSIAELLGEMLSLLGHKPTLCHSGPEALEWVGKVDFDVVLSDFRMPLMDGQQFYREAIRRKPALTKRGVFLTGDVVTEETQDFLKSMGNPYLAKPFQLSRVEETLNQVLAQNEAGEG